MRTIETLMEQHAHHGEVQWIGLRTRRRGPVEVVSEAAIGASGLVGDRRQRPGKRAVTLFQWEHLPVIAALSAMASIDPALLRRNIGVSGLQLLALRNRPFRLGSAILVGTGLCAPCSYMEEALGKGGYNAVRGHGGICARVMREGEFARGDALVPLCANEAQALGQEPT
ncbi:MAG: MOSC domain-containing protein [Pseudomonadota bacterium]